MSAFQKGAGPADNKRRMKQEIHRISNFLALKYTHFTILALTILAAVYLALLLQSIQGLYSAAAFFFSPYLIFYIRKRHYELKISERFLLDSLSQKYGYHENLHSTYSISFFLEAFILLLWQLSNYVFPYEVLVPQYLPGALLILMCLLRIFCFLFFCFNLHRRLMNNNL